MDYPSLTSRRARTVLRASTRITSGKFQWNLSCASTALSWHAGGRLAWMSLEVGVVPRGMACHLKPTSALVRVSSIGAQNRPSVGQIQSSLSDLQDPYQSSTRVNENRALPINYTSRGPPLKTIAIEIGHEMILLLVLRVFPSHGILRKRKRFLLCPAEALSYQSRW